MQLVFDIVYKEIGIFKLFDVEDVCDVVKFDECLFMMYIVYWFYVFFQMEKVENVGWCVEKFVNNMQGVWEMQSVYERRMVVFFKVICVQIESWQIVKFEGIYVDVKVQVSEFVFYKRGVKREWVVEKSELVMLLGNIKIKLGMYWLWLYDLLVYLSLDMFDREWLNLIKFEMVCG